MCIRDRAGDLGCSGGPTLVGVVSGYFGDDLRKGILAAVVFPVLLLLGIKMCIRDSSIVVLESCFRATDKKRGGFVEYLEDALKGTNVVWASILGGTATTCVVFLPLAFLEGMTGQMFKPLGFTIVFCMVASLVAAITVVPLCYMMYKPCLLYTS